MGRIGFEINHNKFFLVSLRIIKNKTELHKSNLINLKIFCTARETLNKRKRQSSKWEKMVTIQFKNNLFISNTCKQFIQLDIKNNQLKRKTGQRSKQTFILRRHPDGHKAHEKMLSITVREMSIKTAMRYHLTLLRIAILLRFISSYEDETLRRPRGTGTPTLGLSSVQFSRSVVSDSFDPMNRSTPGLPVHHQLPESTQSHVHRVGDAIQASHSLSSPSPPALNLSQHQGLFQ